MRTCKACQAPLSRRSDETSTNFARRFHCNRKCGLVTSIGKRRGELCGTARLSEDQVRDIKRELRAGSALSRVAATYGVSMGAVISIKYGQNWKHVD